MGYHMEKIKLMVSIHLNGIILMLKFVPDQSVVTSENFKPTFVQIAKNRRFNFYFLPKNFWTILMLVWDYTNLFCITFNFIKYPKETNKRTV